MDRTTACSTIPFQGPSAERPRLPALTALRFFAAMHVVLFHMGEMGVLVGRGWYRRFASIGYVGVSLFFVLSGFILVYTYAGRETTKREFWRARFARVYPAYLFSLLVTAPPFFYVCIAMKSVNIPFFAWFKAHLALCAALVPALLQAWVPGAALAWNAPAWSLSVEAFFYLLFPFMIVGLARARTRALALTLPACWCFSLIATGAYVVLSPDGVSHTGSSSAALTWLGVVKFNPLVRLPEFAIGLCCGLLFVRGAVDRRWATPLAAAGLLVFAAVVASSPSIPYPMLHDAVLPPAFAALVLGIALGPRWTVPLAARPLVLLGEASYSLYLLHATVIAAFFGIGATGRHRTPMGIVGGLALMLLISMLVYRWIEEPARRWLRPRSLAHSARAVSTGQAA